MKLDTKELKTITLLYVEDDKEIRYQTNAVFEKIFKKVFIAVDGEDGLACYTKNKNEIDIVVTDINMPNLNGLDMIQKINEISTNIPTIVTTAHTDSSYLMDAININVDKYIAKPFQIKELTVSIVNLVLKYRRINNMELLAKNLVNQRSKDEGVTSNLNIQVEKLTMKNNYLKAIVDNFVVSITTDKNGNIQNVSDKFLRYFEFAKSEIVGQNISTLRCSECSGESLQKTMLQAIHTKKTVTTSYTFQKKDKTSIPCSLTLTPTYSDEQLVDGYSIYVDIL